VVGGRRSEIGRAAGEAVLARAQTGVSVPLESSIGEELVETISVVLLSAAPMCVQPALRGPRGRGAFSRRGFLPGLD